MSHRTIRMSWAPLARILRRRHRRARRIFFPLHPSAATLDFTQRRGLAQRRLGVLALRRTPVEDWGELAALRQQAQQLAHVLGELETLRAQIVQGVHRG